MWQREGVGGSELVLCLHERPAGGGGGGGSAGRRDILHALGPWRTHRRMASEGQTVTVLVVGVRPCHHGVNGIHAWAIILCAGRLLAVRDVAPRLASAVPSLIPAAGKARELLIAGDRLWRWPALCLLAPAAQRELASAGGAGFEGQLRRRATTPLLASSPIAHELRGRLRADGRERLSHEVVGHIAAVAVGPLHGLCSGPHGCVQC
mmetsp:Transcript_20171/g.56805  ORF Transcript_20171/g.56805 Transcript_20171/m.56805 type:complete len:207 (+) Transcript_20171:984-1604(+)